MSCNVSRVIYWNTALKKKMIKNFEAKGRQTQTRLTAFAFL